MKQIGEKRRQKPLEEVSIPKFSFDALQEDEKLQSQFLHWMNVEGFSIFTFNEEMQELVELYWTLCQDFFSETSEYKSKFKGKPKYKDEIGLNRQVNKGYLTAQEKEFLKLCLSDPTQTLPEDIEMFEETFMKLCTQMEDIAMFLYRLIACSKDPETGKPIHDEKAMDVISSSLRLGSSVAMINYHPIEKKNAKVTQGRDEPTNDSHFPSATHCDTGFLTMIMCSTVPALQIKDRFNDSWFMPEKVCDPKKDCFVILGRKMNQFADFNHANSEMFSPTVHRVMLPYNTQRNSLLYFQDIPQ